jgi:predicted RNase H-like HicB family nuclease
MRFNIEFDREEDGRIAEATDLPGVMVHGRDRAEACVRVIELASRVLAERSKIRDRR